MNNLKNMCRILTSLRHHFWTALFFRSTFHFREKKFCFVFLFFVIFLAELKHSPIHGRNRSPSQPATLDWQTHSDLASTSNEAIGQYGCDHATGEHTGDLMSMLPGFPPFADLDPQYA